MSHKYNEGAEGNALKIKRLPCISTLELQTTISDYDLPECSTAQCIVYGHKLSGGNFCLRQQV
jgi:hypothetical protein